jgi:photosystem II stability/assembly factor-like uncharacterized protein
MRRDVHNRRMRASAALVVSFILVVPSLSALQWSTHGPNGGAVAQIAVSPAAPRVVYAAGGAGVFRSDDAGDTWRDVSGTFHGVSQLAVDPKNADVLFATAGQRLYKSTDGGASWLDLTGRFPRLIRPSSLVIDPTDSSTVYLGSRCGPIGFSTLVPTAAPVVVPNGDPFFGAGVYKSIDGGATWTTQLSGLNRPFSPCVEELSLDPAAPQHLFATPVYSDGGYSESYDGGVTWTRAPSYVPGHAVVDDRSLALTRYGISTTTRGFLKSGDGGVTWSFSYQVSGIPTSGFNDVAQDPATGRLFVATDRGLFRSGDGGLTWVDAGVPPAPTARVLVDGVAGYVFAANALGLYRSAVPLGTWQRLDVGDPSTDARLLVTDPHDPATLYTLTSDYQISSYPDFFFHGRVFVSHDYAGSWQLLRENDSLANASMTVDPAGDLYVHETDGLWRYSPGAGTWTQRTRPPAALLAADPGRAGLLYAYGVATRNFGVSADGGQTWTSSVVPLLYGAQACVVDASTQPSTVYVGSNDGIGKSVDGGLTWAKLSFQSAYLLAIAPSKPSRLYWVGYTTIRGSQAVGLSRSDDAGVSWTMLTLPDELSGVLALATDPHDAQSLWITEGTGRVLHSEDAGATWADAGFSGGAGALALSADVSHVYATQTLFGVWSAAVPPAHRRRAGH